MAGSHFHVGPRGHRGDDVAARTLHRLGQRKAERQMGGDRGRQRAARAMKIGALDARGRKPQPFALTFGQQVDHVVARQVPALEQHRMGAEREQFGGGLVERIDTVDRMADQERRLVEIGRDDDRSREQFAHQHGHRLGGDEAIAAGGHHHRIEHHVSQLVVVDGPRNDFDDLGRMQHPQLDCVDADVLDHRLDLRLQEDRRHAVDAGHTERVLRRQCGDRGHPVAAERREGLEVGLDAGAPAAVGAGDRKHACVARECSGHAENYRSRARRRLRLLQSR